MTPVFVGPYPILGNDGRPAVGVPCTVTTPDGGPATVYVGIEGLPTNQPVFADSVGAFSAWLAPGTYTVTPRGLEAFSVTAPDEPFLLSRASGIMQRITRAFGYADADNLAEGLAGFTFADGAPVGTLPVGTLIQEAGIFIPTAFNGTTPKGDVGLYNAPDTLGFLGTPGPLIDLTLADFVEYTGTRQPSNKTWAQTTVTATQEWPAILTVAAPLLVVASQDGSKGGAAIDSTAGVGQAWALIALP